MFASGLKSFLCALALAASACGALAECAQVRFAETPFTVCQFETDEADIRIFHSDEAGGLYGQFDALATDMAGQGLELRFAMNAGMYHPDRAPVGLCVIAGEALAPLSLADGPGNFHLRPNGVFWIDGNLAGVSESSAFAQADLSVDHATQSGPMLVIGGELHPALRAQSRSRYRRNGVGVSEDGQTVSFAISEVPVSLHLFARLFRDHLDTPNALYLDGNISKLYAPALDRNERGLDMGPIIGVVAPVAAVKMQEAE